jgi:ATP-dependent protease ClpP protease subunit
VGQHGGSWLGGLTRGRAAQIQHDFNRNKYFDTSEALEYGIIDRVIKPPRTRVLGV